MMRRPAALICLVFGCLAQQPDEPRAKASDYSAHASAGQVTIGAEFMVHTFSGRGQTFLLPGYLVVEAAVYPAAGFRPIVAHSHFVLRVNGKLQLLAQPPQFAAAGLKYPDWEQKPELTVGAGAGDSGILIGRTPRTERFPGDPRPGMERGPNPPRVPTHEDRSGIAKEPVSPAEVCVEQALPEGIAAGPIRGFLYFPFKGKLKSIRELALLYSSEGGKAVLALR